MPPPKVLVVGSLHHDVIVSAERLPRLDETLRGRAVDYRCGGKGGNQAVAAARHGAETAMLGRVGADAAGKTLLAHLDTAGVDRSGVGVSKDEASGMSVAISTATGEYGAVIVSGANLTIECEELVLPPDLRLVVLQNEISEAANAVVAAKARAAGVKVLLNAAPARPFETNLCDGVDLLIVNRVEAESLSGRAVNALAVAAAAACDLTQQRRDVIITLGAEGLVYAPAAGPPRHLAARPVDIVSSHGAGDAFVGALAARLALDDAMPEALGYAQAAAALHVSSAPDARAGITPQAVQQLLTAG